MKFRTCDAVWLSETEMYVAADMYAMTTSNAATIATAANSAVQGLSCDPFCFPRVGIVRYTASVIVPISDIVRICRYPIPPFPGFLARANLTPMAAPVSIIKKEPVAALKWIHRASGHPKERHWRMATTT